MGVFAAWHDRFADQTSRCPSTHHSSVTSVTAKNFTPRRTAYANPESTNHEVDFPRIPEQRWRCRVRRRPSSTNQSGAPGEDNGTPSHPKHTDGKLLLPGSLVPRVQGVSAALPTARATTFASPRPPPPMRHLRPRARTMPKTRARGEAPFSNAQAWILRRKRQSHKRTHSSDGAISPSRDPFRETTARKDPNTFGRHVPILSIDQSRRVPDRARARGMRRRLIDFKRAPSWCLTRARASDSTTPPTRIHAFGVERGAPTCTSFQYTWQA